MAVSGCDNGAGLWLAAYQAPLVGFVLPIVNGDLQAAEDVVQETMLRGWQHAGELDPEQAGSWLHKVARNIAISSYHRRRQARPREVPLDESTAAAGDGLEGIVDREGVDSAPGRASEVLRWCGRRVGDRVRPDLRIGRRRLGLSCERPVGRAQF